ncbi:MAG: hypothetical protein Q8P93_00820 [bacterium]|nr:hypothetical protein [bacterium]
MKHTIGIIGHGFVGKAVENGFTQKGLPVYAYDKYKKLNSFDDVITKSSIFFLCLPTPFKEKRIDLSIIDEVMHDIANHPQSTNKIFVIKSTVIPGTTTTYQKQYPTLTIAFNPEFLTEANYLDDFMNADRTVIGASDTNTKETLQHLYKTSFPETPVLLTDPTTAEFSKYMANCFLATKVLFANEVYDLATKIGVHYDEAVDIVTADARIGNSHFAVTPERGFGGKCFPKDMIALLGLFEETGIDSELLATVWKKNLRMRKDFDWERIPFVTNTKPPQRAV